MVFVLGSLTSGPLGPYAAGFAEELARQGYTVSGGEQHLRAENAVRGLCGSGVFVDDAADPVVTSDVACIRTIHRFG